MKTKNGRRVMTVAGDVMLSLEDNAPTVLAGSVKRDYKLWAWIGSGHHGCHKGRNAAAIACAEYYERQHDLGPIKSVDDLADEESQRGDEADAEDYLARIWDGVLAIKFPQSIERANVRQSLAQCYLAGRRSR